MSLESFRYTMRVPRADYRAFKPPRRRRARRARARATGHGRRLGDPAGGAAARGLLLVVRVVAPEHEGDSWAGAEARLEGLANVWGDVVPFQDQGLHPRLVGKLEHGPPGYVVEG